MTISEAYETTDLTGFVENNESFYLMGDLLYLESGVVLQYLGVACKTNMSIWRYVRPDDADCSSWSIVLYPDLELVLGSDQPMYYLVRPQEENAPFTMFKKSHDRAVVRYPEVNWNQYLIDNTENFFALADMYPVYRDAEGVVRNTGIQEK